MKEMSNKQILKLLKQKLDNLVLLEKQNDELNRELEVLNKKLEESEAFKSHFISNVTNEIINPFSSVMGLSKAIMKLKNEDLKKAPSLASLIYSEAAFLDFQLNNIFAAAKIEAGEIAFEVSTINITELIENSLKKLQHEIDKKKIEVVYNPELTEGSEKLYYFKSDNDKLQLIVVNLLSNAIKSIDKNGKIHINTKLENNNLIIEIIDNGKGINEKEKSIIFDRFSRIDTNINSLNPGNGLGLSVVKGLLDIIEGEIDIKSSVGKGTTVTVKVPEAVDTESVFDDDLFDDFDNETF